MAGWRACREGEMFASTVCVYNILNVGLEDATTTSLPLTVTINLET